MLIVTGHTYIEPSQLSLFLADLLTLAIATRLRAGNIAYHAAVEDAALGQVLVSERWADQASLSAHLQAAGTLSFVSKWQGQMHGEIRRFDVSNERALTDS